MKYTLNIIWLSGEIERFTYQTELQANIILQGYKTAFGHQISYIYIERNR